MYRNSYWDRYKKKIVLATWDKFGNRRRVDVPFEPYLYVENPKGEYTSIFKTKLKKVSFKTPWDREQFKTRYGGKRFYEDFGVEQQFLLDAFWKSINDEDFSKYPLRTLFYDIEVDPLPGGEFPDPNEAKAQINIITAYDYLDKKYHVFSKRAYTGDGLGENVVFNDYPNERQLLQAFLDFWKSEDYPDIVSGWNSGTFDNPYLFNRVIKVLGEEAYESLSPYKSIYATEKLNKFGKKYNEYHIGGVTLLDWLDVYAKYKGVKQESYKLDFIANMELGIGKVDYNGMTIYEFMEYDWNRFVEYNIRDVELLVKLEDKLKYFSILRQVSYMGCMNFEKCLNTIPQTNGAVSVRCRQRGLCLNTFDRSGEEKISKPGGFVSTSAGFHRNVVTVDANSLYPNLTISNNISPETIIGMAYFKLGGVYGDNPEDELTLRLVNGRKLEIKRAQLQKIIKEKNLVLSANGALFRQDFEGVLPQFMREVYEWRLEAKKVKRKLEKENEKLGEELKELEAQLAQTA